MLKTLGRYQISEEIGRGAMGVVYKAYDPATDRFVAIKTIRKDLLDADLRDQILERFKHEAQSEALLNHNKIVGVYDVDLGAGNGTVFIAMEYVDAPSLDTYLKKKPIIPLEETLNIMCQILDGLDCSHNLGVIHRDIKPGNILLMDNGNIKISDFGIARIETSDLTRVGEMIGTPGYMSPEQISGESVDKRCDLFSAGVLFYRLLTGEKPFTGNVPTIMHQTIKTRPKKPSNLNHDIPKLFDAIIMKAIEKNPNERFQTAMEFLYAIKAAKTQSEGRKSSKRKSKITLFGAAVGLIAGFVTAIYFYLQPDTGIIAITSKPSGASVLLNNRILGTTPTRIDLEPGEYRLELRKNGYPRLTVSVEVEPDVEIPISLTFRRNR